MAFFVGEEFLLAELEHFRLMMEYLILILICYLNYLIILFKDQLWAFNLSSLVEVREDEQLIKCLLAAELGDIREQHLLSTNQLTLGRGCRLIVEVNKEFTEFDGAFCRVGFFGWLFQKVLVSDLIFTHLRACIGGGSSSYFIYYANLLIVNVGCSSEGVHCVASLALS